MLQKIKDICKTVWEKTCEETKKAGKSTASSFTNAVERTSNDMDDVIKNDASILKNATVIGIVAAGVVLVPLPLAIFGGLRVAGAALADRDTVRAERGVVSAIKAARRSMAEGAEGATKKKATKKKATKKKKAAKLNPDVATA